MKDTLHPFTRFVIDNHPDPDSIYTDKWDEIEKMAQQYALSLVNKAFEDGVEQGYQQAEEQAEEDRWGS